MPAVTGADDAAVVARLRAAGCVFAEDEARLLMAAARDRRRELDHPGRPAGGRRSRWSTCSGWAEFCGLRIAVDPGVFVPRRRTEVLVREAVALAPPGAVVVDLCCGSGAVGAALAAVLGAARAARRRRRPGRRRLRAAQPARAARSTPGDLFDALPAGAARPRRRPRRQRALRAERRHRADAAGGARARAADGARRRRRRAGRRPAGDRRGAGLAGAGGSLLFETGEAQVPAAAGRRRARAGCPPRVVTDDELGATVVVGTAGLAAHRGQLAPQVRRRLGAAVEHRQQHPLVRRVDAVGGQPGAEEQQRRARAPRPGRPPGRCRPRG